MHLRKQRHDIHFCQMRAGNRSSSSVATSQNFLAFFFFFRAYGSSSLGVQSELHLLACTTAIAMLDPGCGCDLHHSSQQCQIFNPLCKARDQTRNFMVPSRIKPASSWILVGFITTEPPRELLSKLPYLDSSLFCLPT